MSSKTILLHEGDNFRIAHRTNGGQKAPRHFLISFDKIEGLGWSRHMKLTEDELFDLTDALDVVCDDLEDRNNEKNGE